MLRLLPKVLRCLKGLSDGMSAALSLFICLSSNTQTHNRQGWPVVYVTAALLKETLLVVTVESFGWIGGLTHLIIIMIELPSFLPFFLVRCSSTANVTLHRAEGDVMFVAAVTDWFLKKFF